MESGKVCFVQPTDAFAEAATVNEPGSASVLARTRYVDPVADQILEIGVFPQNVALPRAEAVTRVVRPGPARGDRRHVACPLVRAATRVCHNQIAVNYMISIPITINHSMQIPIPNKNMNSKIPI